MFASTVTYLLYSIVSTILFLCVSYVLSMLCIIYESTVSYLSLTFALCSLCILTVFTMSTILRNTPTPPNLTYSHTYAIPRMRVPLFLPVHVTFLLLAAVPYPLTSQSPPASHRPHVSRFSRSSLRPPYDAVTVRRFKPCSHMPACICPHPAANARKSPFRPVSRVV